MVCNRTFLYCHRCLAIFMDRKSLDKHQRKIHIINKQKNNKIKVNELKYKCIFCKKGFKEKRKQIYHQRIHINDRKEKCKFCSKTFTDPSTKRQHIINIHSSVGTKKYACKKCNKPFNKLSLLKIHWKIHQSNVDQRKIYKCQYCKYIYK
eukprot:444917_1